MDVVDKKLMSEYYSRLKFKRIGQYDESGKLVENA
jgi:hypothetical protein